MAEEIVGTVGVAIRAADQGFAADLQAKVKGAAAQAESAAKVKPSLDTSNVESGFAAIGSKAKSTFSLVSKTAGDAGLGLNPLVGALGNVDSAMKSVEGNSSKVTKTLVGVGAGVAGVGALLTKMGDESRRATAQLNLAIENSGASVERYSGRINTLTNRMIKLGFDDEAVARGLATLTTAFQDPAKALDLMGMAADIARARHISLESAVDKLAKTASGNTKVFKEFGIEISATATAEEKAAAMAELQRRVQGQAAEASKDWTGKLTALKIQAENVAEAVGQKAGPALTFLGPVLAGVGGLTTATNLSLGQLAGKVGVFGLLAAGAATAVYAIGQMNEKVKLSATEIVGLAKASDQTQVAFIANANQYKKYGVDVTSVFQQVAESSEGSARRMLAALEAQGTKSGLTKKQLADMKSTLDQVSAGNRQAATDADSAATGFDNESNKAKDLATTLRDKLADAQSGLIDKDLAYQRSINTTVKAMDDQVKKEAALKKAIDEHGESSQETADAADALSRANETVVDSVNAEAKAHVDLIVQQRVAKNLTTDATQKADLYRQSLVELANRVEDPLRTQILGLAHNITVDLPSSKRIDITADTSQARESIGALTRQIQALDPNISLSAAYHEANLEGRQFGGPVLGGKRYLVGEKAPEILELDRGTSGRIIPLDAAPLSDMGYSRTPISFTMVNHFAPGTRASDITAALPTMRDELAMSLETLIRRLDAGSGTR